MEEAKHQFESEPTRMAPTHETRPPRRPDKIPLDAAAPVHTVGYLRTTHSQTHDSKALRIGADAADAAISRPKEPDTSRSADRNLNDELSALRRQVETLQTQLLEVNDRADQADRATEELRRRLEPRQGEAAATSDDPAGSVKRLTAEVKVLKAELDDARSHIFSLQPYQKDLTPEEAGLEFDDLVNNVTNWATKLADPILDDPDKVDEVLAMAKKKQPEVEKLRKYMSTQCDLVNGCMHPETDVDIFIAIVMRFLQDNIFQKMLIGAVPSTIEVLTNVESSMRTNVEPKRDLFALRTWRAETMNAVICSPDYQKSRAARLRELTIELANLFKPVMKKDKDWSRTCPTIRDEIIKPAVALYERFLTSTHHFYLDLNTYMVWNGRQNLETTPDFVDNLAKLKCENILQNRKPFNVAKLDPRPTAEQLRRELTNVVTVVPALYMRQVGRADVLREPVLVRMQQVLVAWGPPEKREKFLANSERTLLHRLYNLQREKPERGQEGSVWGNWRFSSWA